MPESSASSPDRSLAKIEHDLRCRLDALQRGECTAEQFVQEILALRQCVPNIVWTSLALLDQHYRRGHLRSGLFLAVKSKISRHELNVRDYGITVDLQPALGATSEEQDARPEIAVGDTAAGADSSHRVASEGASVSTDAAATLQAAPPSKPVEIRDAPRAHDVGRVLCNRYTLESVLGCGGTSTVFKALDRQRADLPEEHRRVALKALNADINQHPEVFADLRREFYCAQALSHPNIVKLYEIHRDGDVAFFTMELLEGELLSRVLEDLHPQPLERSSAWAIIRDVGAGLAHAHARGVVHGDLKPQNILLTAGREVRILDFGVAATATRQWSNSDPLQRNRLPAVTLAYACCELLDGQDTDPRDDLYSLACLAYELLAGTHPFQRRRSTEARELGMQPSRPPGLTQRQWRSLRRGLSWHRDSRSFSVRDWLAQFGLQPAAEKLPPLPAADQVQHRSWKRSTVRNAALAVCVLAAIGFWMTFGQPRFDRYANTGASKVHLDAPSDMPAPPISDGAVPDLKRLPTPTPMTSDARPVPALQPAADALQLVPATASDGTAPGHARATGARKITLSADTYRLRSGERFAEIMVRRSNVSSANSSFAWWTESGSAKPGRDFIAQNWTTQFFSNGRYVARLFVRIVPNPNRKPNDAFYVVIAAPSAGYTLGPVTRAAVLAPPGDSANEAKTVASNMQVR